MLNVVVLRESCSQKVWRQFVIKRNMEMWEVHSRIVMAFRRLFVRGRYLHMCKLVRLMELQKIILR